MRARDCRTMVTILFALQIGGCSKWVVVGAPPTITITERMRGRIQIVRTDGTVLVLRDASMSNDSIYGRPCVANRCQQFRVGMLASTVQAVRVTQPDPTSTVIMVGAAVAMTYLISLLTFDGGDLFGG